jgi:SagB-type dehydrogenase family enzyme
MNIFQSPEADQPPPEELFSVSELYHENSKQQRYDTEFGRRIAAVNSDPYLHRVITQAYKVYAGVPRIELPQVHPQDGPSFEQVAARRRSVREFGGEPLSLEETARLLHYSSGITGYLPPSDGGVVQPVRAAPSGGALFPVEVYPVVRAVEGLQPGIYHYAVAQQGLELLREGDFSAALSQATAYPEIFEKASLTLALTILFGRTKFKYGERGYRFALLEAGHIAQNMLLSAEALELGATAVGGFIDDEVNALLDVDGVDESTIYLIAVGRPAAPADPLQTGEFSQEREAIIEDLLASLWGAQG